MLNISRFSPRANTHAAMMKEQISGGNKKERSRTLTELFNRIALNNNKKWVGWKGKILIDEIGKNNTFVGRNFAYKPVIVRGKFKLGDEIEVTVKDGETTVIGGLYKSTASDADNSIPYLSKIPILGWLFKSNSKIADNEELLVFITPRIVKYDSQIDKDKNNPMEVKP